MHHVHHFRTDYIRNDVEYMPAYNPKFATELYGIPDDVDEESEKSYEETYFAEGFFATFVFLSFQTTWCVVAAVTVTSMYTILSYTEFFDHDALKSTLMIFYFLILCAINLVDIGSSMLHFVSGEWRQLDVYKRKNLMLIMIDCLSVTACIMILVLQILQPATRLYSLIALLFTALRLYRMIEHFVIVSRSPLCQGLKHVLIKYTFLTFVITHTTACMWKYNACWNCNDGMNHWNDIFSSKTTPLELYILCMFNSLDAAATMGMVGGSARNTQEFALCLLLVMYCMIVHSGAFLGTFTEVQVVKSRRRSEYLTKRALIQKRLAEKVVTDRVRKAINKWYVNFWVKENGIIQCPILSENPFTLRRDIQFDKYFVALNTSHHLRGLHDELKIAIATTMSTSYYNKGDAILHQGQNQNSMIYVAKGIVQLVSPDDIESSIIMFKFGTSIGSPSLLYSSPIKAHLVATTYCQVYILKKSDLWRTLGTYYKLRGTRPIFETQQVLLWNAFRIHFDKRPKRRMKRVDKTLKLVKHLLTKRNKREITGKLSENNLHSVYQINTGIGVSKEMDQTFVMSSYPWILYKGTHLWMMWKYILFTVALIVIVIYPYCLIYLQYPPTIYHQLLRPCAYAVFTTDVVIQLFTSTVDSHQQLISENQEILAYRIGKLLFIIDLISIIPLEIIYILASDEWSQRRAYVECNHMLKVFRVFRELIDITFRLKGKAIKVGFYTICLMYFGYLQGLVYFKTACPTMPCEEGSWIDQHVKTALRMQVVEGNSSDYILLVSIYDGVMMLTGAAGVIPTDSIRERAVLALFCITYLFLFTYLLADYSATLTLDRFLQDKFQRDVHNLRSFMVTAKLNKSIVERVNTYMETIYTLADGQVMRNLMDDLPLRLVEMLEVDKTLPYIENIPVIKIFKKKYRNLLLAKAKYETYPANEFVAYAGDRSFNMYIIRSGYCEITRSGLNVISQLQPGDNTGVLEMMLGLPLAHDIKTLTNVKLIYLNIKDFREVFYLQSGNTRSFVELLKPMQESRKLGRTIKITADLHLDGHKEMLVKHEPTIVSFKGGKMDPRTVEFNQGWSGYSLISFMLLKMTIIPDSRFLYIYVMFHAVIAFMSSVIYPAMFLIECTVPWYVVLLMTIPFDFLCMIDVFLRLHVCTYTSNGLLVSHPRWTASYYLKHAFAVDFLTALPLKLIFDSFVSKNVSAYIMFVKIIRAYRIPNGFSYFRRDILKAPPTYFLILLYLSLSLVFWNSLTVGLVLISTNVRSNADGYTSIELLNASFFYTKVNSEITIRYGENPSPMRLYLLALYATTSFSLQISLVDIGMLRSVEMIYIILTLISGYIWFTYMLVIISNTEAVHDDTLTQYKNNLKDLCSFMKKQGLPKILIGRLVRHFEYIYQRSRGYRNEGFFDEYHSTLRNDSQWDIHGSTLLAVPVFKNMDLTFYQRLCAELRIVYYVQGNNILCVNDVINWVYIIKRGTVHVIDPAGAVVEVITKGAIFGNLDNVMYSRSLLQFTTVSTVDILCIQTERLYAFLEDNQTAKISLKASLFNNNFCYIKSKELPHQRMSHLFLTSIYTSWFKILLMSSWIKFVYLFIAYLSYQLTLFHLTFQKEKIAIYVAIYLLDAFHIMKIYYYFITPFIDEVGDVIAMKDIIRKRVLKMKIIYIDIVAAIPFEIFAFACPLGYFTIHNYIAFFRLNKVLRFFSIPIHIKDIFELLHLNGFLIKVASLFIYSTTFFNLLACLWYALACPNNACTPGTWIFDAETDTLNCNQWPYLCTMYYVASLVSLTGFTTFEPRKISEITFCIVTLVLSKFVLTLLVANMAALVRHYSYRLLAYTEQINVLKAYFKNMAISPQLQRNILKYSERLWLYNSGIQMPIFLKTGPSLLIEELKIYAFGNHIFSNPVFRDCHNDFLRMVTVHAKLMHYFLGDVICNQDEINDTMYFIHWGQVEVLCITARLEVQVDLLTQLDCFGMIQGLFPDTPHSHTYRACATTEVVTLNLKDWMQNLAFYPSARFHIYRTIRNYNGLFKFIRNPSQNHSFL